MDKEEGQGEKVQTFDEDMPAQTAGAEYEVDRKAAEMDEQGNEIDKLETVDLDAEISGGGTMAPSTDMTEETGTVPPISSDDKVTREVDLDADVVVVSSVVANEELGNESEQAETGDEELDMDMQERGGRESSLPGSRGGFALGEEHEFDDPPTAAEEEVVEEVEEKEEKEEIIDDLVEVELSVLPEHYVHRQRWPRETTAEEVLDDVAKLLGLARESLSLYTVSSSDQTGAEGTAEHGVTPIYERKLVSKTATVSSLNPSNLGKINLELVVDTVRPLKLLRKAGSDAMMQGQMKVEVDLGNEAKPKHLLVIIERHESALNKEYLGGYRHKKTGIVYHHATVQTDNEDEGDKKTNKVVSSTQTYRLVTATIQTGREASTQMKRPDLMIDESTDFHMTPGTYITSEEYMKMKLASIIVIQCHARGYLARKLARRLRHEKIEADLAAENEKQLTIYELERRRKFEIERRMNPKSHEDFTILRKELEAWKAQELMQIRTDPNEDDRHQRMLALLNKETKLLQTIDRLKIHAASDNRDVRIATMLSEMSQPKDWALKDGDTLEVHTPFTIRARELMQLYNALRLPLLTMDERLDVLLHVKWTVKEFDCNLTREIVSLVDREADLLNRGRDVQKLINLRKRTANLFLEFIETPEFNPEAERFRLVA